MTPSSRRRLAILLLFQLPVISATSIPEDLYAFPKFRVSFLNDLPVTNTTAETWLRRGLVQSEHEFLSKDRNGNEVEPYSLSPIQVRSFGTELDIKTYSCHLSLVRRTARHASQSPTNASRRFTRFIRLSGPLPTSVDDFPATNRRSSTTAE